MLMKRLGLPAAGLTGFAMLCVTAAPGFAQNYPDQTVTLIVPSSAGGGSDSIARILAEAASPIFGQSIVVENKPGASGTVGTDLVAKAKPDGYTWGLIGNAQAANVSLSDDLPFDLLKDLAPATQVNASPHVVVVHPSLEVKTLAELVALAKEKPDTLNYASAGVGTVTFLATEIFKDQAGMMMTEIPYQGGGESLRAVVAGETQVYFSPLAVALPFIQDGKLRALAVTSKERMSLLPDVPTVAESGYAGFDASLWLALMAPAGTPPAIIERLNREMVALINTPETRDAFDKAGTEQLTGTPAALAAMIREGLPKYGAIVKASGVKAE
jgi:tripartite-type tricarboxylate transporter receptor subunit TctC